MSEPTGRARTAYPPASGAGDLERRPLWIGLAAGSVRRLVTVLVMAAVVVMVVLWAFHALSSFLFLLLLAWLLSIAMEPMVAWLIRAGVRRGGASAIGLFPSLINI